MINSTPKSLEDILKNKKFGSLSILVPLMILIVGIVIVISSFFISGGTHDAGVRSIELLATVVTLATTGSIASYGFKSQTKIDLENYVSSLNTSTVKSQDGNDILSLSSDSADIVGNFSNNVIDETTTISASSMTVSDVP